VYLGGLMVSRSLPCLPTFLQSKNFSALAPGWLPRLRLPTLSSGERRLLRRLLGDYRRAAAPAPVKPDPAAWPDDALTAAWLGHSTVLINFFGITILTDPALNARVGLGAGPFILGPKRYVKPALRFAELPPIDLVLLSHAHMDHFDLPTLRRFDSRPAVVTARATADLLRWTRLRRRVNELDWGQRLTLRFPDAPAARAVDDGGLEVEAFEVRHWGARVRTDDYRGYNGYILRRGGMAVLVAGDTAYTPLFGKLRGRGAKRPGANGAFDLALMPIGAYDPWIGAHCNPEQAAAMADAAGARAILPVHHQTFQLSYEPMEEPIRRLERALTDAPERIALRRIGETVTLSCGASG
jgi:L-ascorbate metabolism protein UlaG (beta-lactamase superfamily)